MKKLPKWLLIALPIAAVLVGALLLILLWPKQAPQKDTPATETTVTTGGTEDTSDQQPPEFSVDDPAEDTPDILPPVVPPEWRR